MIEGELAVPIILVFITTVIAMFVYNPEGFEPKHYLPPELHRYADCARVFVHLVEARRVYCKKQEDQDYICLKAAYLRKWVHYDHMEAIRDALVKAGVLEMRPHYVRGKHSFSFRLGQDFAFSSFNKIQIHDSRTIQRLQKIRRLQCPSIYTLEQPYRGLLQWLQRVEVDYELAVHLLRLLPMDPEKRVAKLLSLEMLKDKDFFFIGPDRFGRIHTNISNLWRNLRPLLRIQGERLVNIDIANSQPLFFGLTVLHRLRERERNKNHKTRNLFQYPTKQTQSFQPFLQYDAAKQESAGIPGDLKRYIQLCEDGRFYDELMEAMKAQMPKQDFKKLFFRKVLFCKPRNTAEMNVFTKQFPTVAKVLTELKTKDYRNAAQRMQRVESDFVIRRVCRRLLKEQPDTPILTIHDSIMTPVARKDLVRRVMEEEFAKLGIHPRLKVEDACNDPVNVSQVRSSRSEVVLNEIGTDLLDAHPPTVPLRNVADRASALSPLASAG